MICEETNEPWNREWSHFSDTSPSLQLGKIRLWASNEKSNLRSSDRCQKHRAIVRDVIYLGALNNCQNSVARSQRASFTELIELRMSKLFFIPEGKFGKKQFSVRQHWYVAFWTGQSERPVLWSGNHARFVWQLLLYAARIETTKICAFVRDWRWMLSLVIHLREVVFDQGTGIFYEVGGAGGIFWSVIRKLHDPPPPSN